jgi:serine/threonine-protein kinase
MQSGWPFDAQTNLAPAAYLGGIGVIFATFDARTQDSGNVSFSVEAGGRRWFVKTAGDPANTSPLLSHDGRVDLLINAQRLAGSVSSPALPPLRGVVPSAWGPMLVYDWVAGDLVRVPAAQRADPASAHQRFVRLPVEDLTAAIDTILEAHLALCGAGWVACDFYDGSIIYDFAARRTWLIDLDSYHAGSFINDMGQMFGSTRFMAPEEFARGAVIDERTTVFNLGRAVSVFLGQGELHRAGFRGSESQHRVMARACAPDRAARFQSVAEMTRAWRGMA